MAYKIACYFCNVMFFFSFSNSEILVSYIFFNEVFASLFFLIYFFQTVCIYIHRKQNMQFGSSMRVMSTLQSAIVIRSDFMVFFCFSSCNAKTDDTKGPLQITNYRRKKKTMRQCECHA